MNKITKLESFNALSVCFTRSRILASQLAVLSTIACYPGRSSGFLAEHTGLSRASVGRLLAYLLRTNDITAAKPDTSTRAAWRRFYVTAQGVYLINGMLRGVSFAYAMQDESDDFNLSS